MNGETALLQQGFAEFVAAARELERAYVELKQRAEAVDVELQATNGALQQALREREAIFAALPIGLVAVRAGGTIASSNVEAQRLCDAAQAAGVELVRQPAGEVAFAGATVRVRRVGLPDGELVLLEDRSRVEALEGEVRRLDRLAGLSELALGVAHEIKNPLTGVMGFAALLERSEDPAAMRRFAARVVQGVRDVDGIVKTLLGFARSSGKPVRPARIGDVVEGAALAAGLPKRRLTLAGDLDACVDADAASRVLDNLLRNAVEAAPAAAVRVHVDRKRAGVELLVEDDGPGVPAALGRSVFEPFVSTKERGSGLGLPLSARVLAYLGGDLELLNPGEPGARFRVRLPALEPEALPAPAEVGR